MKRTHSKAAALLALAITATSASAAVVSWNLNNWGDSPTGSAATAGVVATSYWNDTWLNGLSNPANDLRDSTNAVTTIDISWASNSGTWNQSGNSHAGVDADGTLNREMLSGYLNGTGANSASVTVNQISYTTYDVYVYFAADNYSRTGTVTDGTTTYSFGVLDNMIAGPNALFSQTTDTGSGNPEANYAVFSGLSGATQTFSTSFMNSGEYGGIAAVQIVEIVPEPSAALLGGLGLLGLLRRRRA